MNSSKTNFLKSAIVGLLACVVSSQASAEEMKFEDPVIGASGYYVGSYGDGAYWVSDGLANSMFVVSDEGVIVVDAPPSYAQSLPAAIAEVTDQPITHFIYSHYHKDHTGAGQFDRRHIEGQNIADANHGAGDRE